MNVYVGQTRSESLIQNLQKLGFGEMTCRGELPPRRSPWAFDNGAFRDWCASKPFNIAAWNRDIKIIQEKKLRPDFLVLPDIVGQGEASLDFSFEYIPRVMNLGIPLYLAVQNGMELAHIKEMRDYIAGVLVGGTLEWKLKTGETWVKWAHDLDLKCHFGRVGGANRVQWCRRIGADSIDSCLPLWSQDNLRRFANALERQMYPELFLKAHPVC